MYHFFNVIKKLFLKMFDLFLFLDEKIIFIFQ